MVMWMGVNTFWTWSGSIQAVACDVGDWLFSLINRGYLGRMFGSPNPAFAEMWWDWPDETAQECNRYVAFNYSDPRHPWTIGVRTRTAADYSATMDFPVLGGPLNNGGALFLHEYGYTENGAPRAPTGAIYAESGAIVAGEGDNRFNVTQIMVDDVGHAEPMVGYRFLVREQPGDAAGEFDTGLYSTLHDGLIDIRFSGRSARMRMQALVDGEWTVGRPRLLMKRAGAR
jgi:hypothetical protein